MSQEAFDRLTVVSDDAYDRFVRLCAQVGNWTMAANAGGVAFVLTTARDLKVEERAPLDAPYLDFLLGLGFGFAGHIAVLFAMMLTVAGLQNSRVLIRQRMAIAAEQGGHAELSESFQRRIAAKDQEFEQNERRYHFRSGAASGIGTMFYITAVIMAAFGLVSPLVSGLL